MKLIWIFSYRIDRQFDPVYSCETHFWLLAGVRICDSVYYFFLLFVGETYFHFGGIQFSRKRCRLIEKVINATNMASNVSDDLWRECVAWLTRCKALPVDHKANWPDSEIHVLALTLRDGVILCNLLNSIDPNALDMKDFNRKPQMAQVCSMNFVFSIFITAERNTESNFREKITTHREKSFENFSLEFYF